jgi:hypothetical protein
MTMPTDVLASARRLVDEKVGVSLEEAAGAKPQDALAHEITTMALIKPAFSLAHLGRSVTTALRSVRCVMSLSMGTSPFSIAAITV